MLLQSIINFYKMELNKKNSFISIKKVYKNDENDNDYEVQIPRKYSGNLLLIIITDNK